MKLSALLVALLWCAPAVAQIQAGGSIINLISTAPQAQTPLSASDLYLVVEAGAIKKVLGTQLSTSVLTNLASAALATLPLGSTDSLVVVQGGVAKRVLQTSTLNLMGLTVGATGLTVTGPTVLSGAVSAPALSVGSSGLTITGPLLVSSATLTIDALGNMTSLTHTLRPGLKPSVPAGGNFVFYVDAFDQSLYVRGWLGTVTKIAKP